MQNFMNPNYYGQYPQYPNYNQAMQPNVNPYADRLAQLQAQQTQLQMSNAGFAPLGKMVESVDIVKATDIPMDGNMYYFPKADGSMVYGKQWLSNGTTRILTFKPVLENEVDELSTNEEKLKIGLSEEATEAFMQRFDDIAEKIEKLERSIKPARAKKEGVADE